MAKLALEHINEEDVRLLVRHPEAERRASAAQRICRSFRGASLSDAERDFAKKLLYIMAEDAVAIVRRALAVTLKNSPHLPRQIALKLAADVDNIAVPILKFSPMLNDEDLVTVLRSKAAAKIMAVAKRSVISGTVVREIIRYGDSRAVAEVAANDGAIIDQDLADQMLDIYHDDDLIKEAFISRRDLPVSVMEKLITGVSEEAALLLNRRHDLPVNIAIDLANRARERASLDVITETMSERDMQRVCRRILDLGRLTPSFLIRAAGFGRMRLLKHGLSVLSGIAPEKTALMIHDGGPFGLKALCSRAGLDAVQTKIIRAACAIFRDLEQGGTDYDQAYFQSLMVERILTLPIELTEKDQAWFLERLDALASDAA